MANCDSCSSKDSKTPEFIPYMAHEFAMVRMERQVKRCWIASIIAVTMLFVSNAAWLYAWCQYDYSSEQVVVDSDDGGNANYIGNNGDIVNGENNSPKAEANQEEP